MSAAPLPSNVAKLHQKPSASIVMVTPEIARRWLERNKSNRNIRTDKVAQYARDMKAGNWELTGTIEFDTDSNLIQGQHRCTAVIESGCTVAMWVLRGVAPSAQRVMDSGVPRHAADNLHMTRGTKNAVAVASIARQRLVDAFGYRGRAISNSEIEQYVDDHPEIELAASIACKYARGCDIAPTTVGLAAWLIADRHGWEVADEFFYTAVEKVGLRHHDPVNAMAKFFAEGRRLRKQYPLNVQMSVIIRAFNYRRAGRPIQFLRAEANGAPVPIPPVVS
jgi:hypothetical protein